MALSVQPQIEDFDTHGSARTADVKVKISTARPGFGSNVEIVTGSLSDHANTLLGQVGNGRIHVRTVDCNTGIGKESNIFSNIHPRC